MRFGLTKKFKISLIKCHFKFGLVNVEFVATFSAWLLKLSIIEHFNLCKHRQRESNVTNLHELY